jgi:hypothetical protein
MQNKQINKINENHLFILKINLFNIGDNSITTNNAIKYQPCHHRLLISPNKLKLPVLQISKINTTNKYTISVFNKPNILIFLLFAKKYPVIIANVGTAIPP